MEVIKLNLIPAGALPVVHASQYDDGREFKAELYEGVNVYTLDGTETLTAIVKKPDGNEVTAAVTNTTDNYVIITTTEQMTACAGGNLGTLRIEKGAVTIATLNFILECQASPDTGIQSDSEIHNFETQVNQMVEDALATQYDSANVVFDNLPTEGHGIPYTVTSEGIGNAIDNALDMTDTASGAIATFESEYALPLRDLEIEINAVQESGTPTPSSPKLISGFTGANIKVTNGNGSVTSDYTLNYYLNSSGEETSSNSWTITNYIEVSGSTLYYKGLTSVGTNPYSAFYDENKNLITPTFKQAVGENTIAIPSGAKYVRFSVTHTDRANFYCTNVASVTPITWQSEAGTVYGGSLDVTNGKLTVTHGFKTYTGASGENWQYEPAAGGTQKNFYIAIPDAKRPQTAQNSTMKCNLSPISNTSGAVQDTCFISNGRMFNFIWGNTLNISSATDFKTWLGSNNLQVCYELATPVTYQLTPTQISAIVGTNNVFTDTNGDTSVEYYAGNGAETAQVAEEIAGVVVADYTAKVVKTKNGTFTNLLASPLNSVWLICCQKITAAGSGFVGIYSFDGVNLNPCVVYIDDMSASFDPATGTVTVKHMGSITDVYGSAFRLA